MLPRATERAANWPPLAYGVEIALEQEELVCVQFHNRL